MAAFSASAAVENSKTGRLRAGQDHGGLAPFRGMEGFMDLDRLGQFVLAGLDEAMRGRPKTIYLRHVVPRQGPIGVTQDLLATVEFIAGYPNLWVSFFAFYSEPIARLLGAVTHCQKSGRVDEVEACLLHVLDPARRLIFDHLVYAGFAYSEDGNWLLWRRPEHKGGVEF